MATISRVVTKFRKASLLRTLPQLHRPLSKNSETQKLAEELPVKFTTSRAATWNAKSSRGDNKDHAPWFEVYAVLSSVTVFMLYFCVIREENDVDIELGKSLFDRVPGLEKKQLELVLSYNESKGLDSTNIRKRLEEIEK